MGFERAELSMAWRRTRPCDGSISHPRAREEVFLLSGEFPPGLDARRVSLLRLLGNSLAVSVRRNGILHCILLQGIVILQTEYGIPSGLNKRHLAGTVFLGGEEKKVTTPGHAS